ncbi:MAG: 16S rRNA (adenine(1518)-N(6)/adenine(1519)-N(6)) -dimethyltransferase RsmA [Peptococcaceae bacterium]
MINPVSSSQVRAILKKYQIHCRKSLGQNFLSDANVVRKIVAAARLDPVDVVVEIGPGLGALTRELAKKARLVLAVEKDETLLPVLKETLAGLENVIVIHEDARKVDFDTLVALKTNLKGGFSYKLVANLPYSITTPLLTYLLRKKFNFSLLVIMVQKEAANRIKALPGSRDYGLLSITVQFYTVLQHSFPVSRTVFVPQPKVDSTVLCLSRREKPGCYGLKEDLFFVLAQEALSQRRKTILNALANVPNGLNPDKNVWLGLLQRAQINPSRRGETLSIEEFSALTQVVWLYLKSRYLQTK